MSDYVNPALCSGCHQSIAKTYSATGMGRSFYRPRPENTVEDYQKLHSLYHPASDRYYSMIARGGHWFQRRHQIGYDGNETNIVETEIDYVIGSGDHARSYLHRTSEGKLIELPVTWYAEKGGYWAMSPGYDRPDQSDFRRAISYGCMSCHNGYPSAPESARADASETVFGSDIPSGIDCQRCHGPGRAHVEAAAVRGATPQSIRQAIVNPARLSRERQLDVCMQCHLQTTSLRSPDSIRRYNRRPFSYRPGEPLRDYMVYFDFAGRGNGEKFEIDHAAYRLAQSQCFQRSQMTCTTCHDPHRQSQGPAAIERYESVCRNCHASAHRDSASLAGKSCLDCHMPKRRTEDVVHAVMTDHYIQRRRPQRDLLSPLREIHPQEAAAVAVTIYDPAHGPSAEAELYRAVAQARQQADPNTGIAQLEAAIGRDHPVRPEFYFELGRAYAKSGQAEKGIHWLEEALRMRSDFSPALKELGAAMSDSGQLARAAEVLERVTAAPSQNAEALTDLGGVYIQEGMLDRAEQVLQRAVAIDPGLPTAYNVRGLERLRRGDRSGAETDFREAIRMQPDLAVAQSNLGNMLAGAGDLRQALFHLKKAIASDPENVDAHYNLGEAFAATGSFDEALKELETAVRLNPKFAKAHNDLGRLLTMRGRNGEALQHFLRASELDPQMGEAHYHLGELFASQKRMREAEQQFRLAIQSDPDDYAAHLALGRILAGRGDLQEAETHFEKARQSPDPELRKAASRAP